MNLDKELIETALRNHGHSYTVQRVVSMEYEDALAKGENYTSTIYRITLKAILGNGRPAKKSLIFKVTPLEEKRTELIKDLGVFQRETKVYTTVLLEMEMLMDEFGDTNDVLWCNLIQSHTPLFCLRISKTTSRQDCLDLDHTLLLLRSLGRFHAMAKILETRGIISKDDYRPTPLVSDRNLIKDFIGRVMKALATGIKMYWGPEWY